MASSWVQTQTKAFTGWINHTLKKNPDNNLVVGDLASDLGDGLVILSLLRILSKKDVSANKRPRMRIQKLENVQRGLSFINNEGIKVVNITAEDIVDGNIKLILGLIWTLILHYHIKMETPSKKSALLQWVMEQVKDYGIENPKNFSNSWSDGQLLTALCDSLNPGTCPLKQTDPKNHPVDDLTRAITHAEQEYDIPPIISADDMKKDPDELSIMTYVAYFYNLVENHDDNNIKGE
eukprot:CAMPEP_0201507924 /NCGR_PEP_ID=MMETSP0161_2-20130828/1430_1 /ASSEMBLY_ACC=CAM_ASM_000251 /TAXON_ID=180227 /ORGANISM="Neoparamoeba aestuarina, Strain SoJaBio B1-5/56/2" /LENGTH=235 /DNA_ID=CAMNT_0047902419 /DNA_START=63 /DNA_END=770 /DNA_ORIENTATION=+